MTSVALFFERNHTRHRHDRTFAIDVCAAATRRVFFCTQIYPRLVFNFKLLYYLSPSLLFHSSSICPRPSVSRSLLTSPTPPPLTTGAATGRKGLGTQVTLVTLRKARTLIFCSKRILNSGLFKTSIRNIEYSHNTID